jgi:hypothetical protein
MAAEGSGEVTKKQLASGFPPKILRDRPVSKHLGGLLVISLLYIYVYRKCNHTDNSSNSFAEALVVEDRDVDFNARRIRHRPTDNTGGIGTSLL